ncbi:RNA polymerase sigma factor [Chryseomicrobium palamuruense]|uniref:RNA polymerase sigma factor n=1 Tax=Chryseomicrobium palamuruense TaxID=682973 RepID=A0ABV8US07_9BACL
MDRSQLHELYQTHAPDMLRMAIAITGRRELAKDALQETFLRVYRFSDTYDSNQPIKPWLYRILINECRRLQKQEARSYPTDSTKLEQATPSREPYSDVMDAVSKLPESYRVPLLLKYMDGWKEHEIADILSLNINTLKSRLAKARELMRIAYGEGV